MSANKMDLNNHYLLTRLCPIVVLSQLTHSVDKTHNSNMYTE